MPPSVENAAESAALARLRSPEAIRGRCREILARADAGGLRHFRLHRERLDGTADYVLATIEDRYPDLDIPFHSRWRHFQVGGVDRWEILSREHRHSSRESIARTRIDLAVTSVLLDAGAGDRWRYAEDGSGDVYSRSEGLAVASFHLFASGAFSSLADNPLQADAAGLAALDAQRLEQAFQVGADNPLVGTAGRAALLQSLGRALPEHPDMFGENPARVGNLYDYLAARAVGKRLPAVEIFAAVLRGLAPIWPDRMQLAGENLGDVWHHGAIRRDDPSNGLVPFHKLSQWLTYSLVEPLEEAGLRVTGLDALTGLPEYRNGGLLVDLGVLALQQPAQANRAHDAGSELVVEWRALTVALLDELAALIRARLSLDAERLPLIRILEGGTWAAGRNAARERRPGGGPPIVVNSDGTVF
jgi:hypothetical protein